MKKILKKEREIVKLKERLIEKERQTHTHRVREREVCEGVGGGIKRKDTQMVNEIKRGDRVAGRESA